MTFSSQNSVGDALFEPVSLADWELPNRLVMAPMTQNHAPGGIPGTNVVDYYRRHAQGGVGLIITEGTYIDRPAARQSLDAPVLFGREALAGWSDVVEAVHGAGVRIVPQLWHSGAMQDRAAVIPDSPSGIGVGGHQIGPPLTELDIDEIVSSYVRAALIAHQLGFDGVELHGAHGYLIDNFLWKHTNHRHDHYGGSPAGRARFGASIVAAIKTALPTFPVVFRFSQWKTHLYTARVADNPSELEALLGPLADAGVDIFHASTRRYWVPEFSGSDLNLAGWAKKVTGRPAITVGSVGLDAAFTPVGTPSDDSASHRPPPPLDELRRRLRDNEFDLVALGRVLLDNPSWPQDLAAGHSPVS